MFKSLLRITKLESLPLLHGKPVAGSHYESVYSDNVPKIFCTKIRFHQRLGLVRSFANTILCVHCLHQCQMCRPSGVPELLIDTSGQSTGGPDRDVMCGSNFTNFLTIKDLHCAYFTTFVVVKCSCTPQF